MRVVSPGVTCEEEVKMKQIWQGARSRINGKIGAAELENGLKVS